ncbi:MAG: insulinase family protein [Nitrospinae bacterium]|nr:insulinase family protein [Nitrospinota bacterium]
MSFETQQTYHGFKCVHRENIKEINSLALLFEHEKTGAELLVMENDDDNKVFSVTFRTPPANDRGVAHILEHSVLCGSRKYPVKEPFVELMKGSLQTFLNAMTFPDKTMYPVASRNQKDFYNLMNVYLDAVFHPRITEETFMQEGWHYELEDPDGPVSYKGVVFNEMKGVFSSPESVLDRYLVHSLFPKTTYGYESGGDPAVIPDLTYEEFKDFHRRYYHPSNSRIFLHGDGNTEDYLKFLHEEYLSGFDRMEVDSGVDIQRRFSKPKWKEAPYPISKDESLEKKTFVVVGLKLDKSTDYEHCLYMEILSHILLGTPGSPLRKALLESNLGSEVIGGGFDDNRVETLFAVGMKGADKEDAQKIVDLIFKTLENLAENGIDENQVLASVNTVDFKLREANFGGFAKGIVYNIQALGSWLYGGNPLSHLKYDRLMRKIKKKSGHFEKLIRKYLLNNKHHSVVVLVPKPGLGEKQEAKVRKQLRQMKASLAEPEIQHLVKTTHTLQERQMQPDPPEALATLPRLTLDDVGKIAPDYPCEIKNGSAPKILFHDLFTNKIAYTQMCFNLETVPQDKIQYLSLLGRLVMGMGTNKRDYVEMGQQIGIRTGGISSSDFSTVSLKDRHRIISCLNLNGTALVEQVDDLFDLVEELLGERNFDNHKRLVEIIRSAKANMEASIVPNGNHYVMSRLQSYHSRLGRYDELLEGITYFRFLEDLLVRVEKDPAEVADCFREVAKYVFTRDNLLANITCTGKEYKKVEKRLRGIADLLPDVSYPVAELEFGPVDLNEAFVTASTVQYVGKAINLYDNGFEFSGQFDVLKALLRTVYLWDHVRVKGGAYGSSLSFDLYTGDLALVSYRDPNLAETLQVYDDIPKFLHQLEMSGEEFEKIVIGCAGKLDPPLTPDRKGSLAKIEHLTGLTHEFKQRRFEELLSTRLDDIREYAGLFETIRDKGTVCALGNESKIKNSASHFDNLVKVFH